MALSRKKNVVPAFNLVPVVEQFLPDRQVSCHGGREGGRDGATEKRIKLLIYSI